MIVVMAGLLAVAGSSELRAQAASLEGTMPVRTVISGDRLRVTVAEEQELSKVYSVAGDGTIDFGYIGRITVADRTVTEVADLLEKKLEETYFKEAHVSVDIAEFVEGSIMVMGAVLKPANIPFKSDEIMTLMEVIMQCGGLTRDADGTAVKILRWRPGGGMERQVLTVDVQSMVEKMDFSQDQYMRPRDIVVVPTLGGGEGRAEFLALGEVGAPGFYPFSEGLDIIRAVTRAGGVRSSARWDAARLLRPNKGGGYSVIPLDLSRLFGAADMTMNVPVLPGDIFFVPSAQQASRGEVFLLGEVAHKGAVPLAVEQNVTLAKTILANGGFTKFANDSKVKILRTAPDGSKQTLVVDVGKILSTGSFEDDVPLEIGDVVIVPERFLSF